MEREGSLCIWKPVYMNSKAVSATADPQIWSKVLERVPPEHQFLSHHWYDVWNRTYAANDDEMHPIVYSSTVTATASTSSTEQAFKKESLFPCVKRSRFGIQVLSMAGYYYPFRTFLCHPDVKEAAIDSFADTVHSQTNTTILLAGPLEAGDQINAPLQASFLNRKWRICEVDAGAQQVVNLPATVEVFRASLGRSLRKNHDKRKRALQAMGQFEISYFNNCTTEEWEQVIDRCATIEAQSWLATDDSGKTRVHGRESFWKSYAAHNDGSKRLSVWVVTLDSTPIAYSLAIDSGSCRYSISGQYDEAYKKHGVGIIADMSMFEQAVESGKRVVNMGDGESEYKRRWGARPSASLQSLYFFKPGAIGWLAASAFRTLERVRHSPVFYRLNRYF